MDIKTKYEIGDKLTDVHTSFTGFLVVHEIQSVTCCAGTQVHYICRSYVIKEPYRNSTKAIETVMCGSGLNPLFKMREDELQPYVEEEPE